MHYLITGKRIWMRWGEIYAEWCDYILQTQSSTSLKLSSLNLFTDISMIVNNIIRFWIDFKIWEGRGKLLNNLTFLKDVQKWY